MFGVTDQASKQGKLTGARTRGLRKVMADNIYLLETRLSKAQQTALLAVREVARAKGLTVFLVGGAVRDLIGGAAVRDLDVVVQGNALKLKKDIEKAGGVIAGEVEAGQALFARFPGGVRMEIGSTLTVTYPKPGKAVAKPAAILDDLRRRDFTANAMALSLNEGSYGLLMDPLNGVADIENRELRLVSNYGFIEDPVRMIRAARYMARLGWHMDEKTQARYETGKAEGYISAMDEFHRGYETEEIFHEEDALRVLRKLEEEGWMQHLAPALSAAKANVAEMERLRESQAQLQTQGVIADAAAANFPLLTAKMAPKEIEALKRSFPRQGFVQEIEGLEAKGKDFAAQLGAKGASLPSQSYKLITSGEAEAVLWVAHTTKSGALQAKFKSFYTEWPQARQRIPYVVMQEMRITPELPEFDSLVERISFELMDGGLGTTEEMKAFLEPYSPPAPPPPVSLRRPRTPKKEAKPGKSRKKVVEPADDAVAEDGAELSEAGGTDSEPAQPVDHPAAAKSADHAEIAGPEEVRVPAGNVKGAKSSGPEGGGSVPKGARSAVSPEAPVKGGGPAKVEGAMKGTALDSNAASKKVAPSHGAKGGEAKSAASSPSKQAAAVQRPAPAKKGPAKQAVPAKSSALGKSGKKSPPPPPSTKSAKKAGAGKPSAGGKAPAKKVSNRRGTKAKGAKAASLPVNKTAAKKTAAKKRR